MSYNPVTDFLGLWRNIAGQVSKVEMPGLDYVVDALARAGLITLSVSATAPIANQSTTAWLQTAVPSYSAEGALNFWNPVTSAYAPATPALFFEMLQTAALQNGVSWWTTTGGPPVNTVGNNGDFAIRTDEPGGIYGPKALGAWPATPIPGTTDIIGSTQLDQTFGTAEGALITRGPLVWQALGIGAADTIPVSDGSLLTYETLSTLLDAVFGGEQGSVLYRDAALWEALVPGAASLVFTSGGPAANPSWQLAPSMFPSGTVMLFRQTAAPTGWTKITSINDYGLRVVSGAVGTTVGTAFSTVFAQTAVGNTTLTTTTIPAHTHTYSEPTFAAVQNGGGASVATGTGTVNTGSIGGGAAHTHSVQLALSYTDVILASKD